MAVVGAAAAYWWPRSYGKMPQAPEPGRAVAMDFDTGFPWSDSNYRTDLNPRSTAVPKVQQIMAYDTFLRWADTGAPRAYWVQTYLIPEASRVIAPYPLIYPMPDLNDVPTTSPIRIPKVQPMPLPSPFPEPAPSPQPAPRPVPVSVAPPGPSIGYDFGPNGVSRIRPQGRPPRGVRERKSKALTAAAVFWEAFNFGTESMDFFESVLEGFGIRPRGWKWNIETLLDILENPSGYEFDVQVFIDSLIANQIEDWVVGNLSRKLTNSLRDLGVKIYGSATPGSGFI